MKEYTIDFAKVFRLKPEDEESIKDCFVREYAGSEFAVLGKLEGVLDALKVCAEEEEVFGTLAYKTLTELLAEFVGNSIDAEALECTIRMEKISEDEVRIEIVDDGEGVRADKVTECYHTALKQRDSRILTAWKYEKSIKHVGGMNLGLKHAARALHKDVLGKLQLFNREDGNGAIIVLISSTNLVDMDEVLDVSEDREMDRRWMARGTAAGMSVRIRTPDTIAMIPKRPETPAYMVRPPRLSLPLGGFGQCAIPPRLALPVPVLVACGDGGAGGGGAGMKRSMSPEPDSPRTPVGRSPDGSAKGTPPKLRRCSPQKAARDSVAMDVPSSPTPSPIGLASFGIWRRGDEPMVAEYDDGLQEERGFIW